MTSRCLQRGDPCVYEGRLYYFQANGTCCYLYTERQNIGIRSKRACTPHRGLVRALTDAEREAFFGPAPKLGDRVRYNGTGVYYFQPKGSGCYLYLYADHVGNPSKAVFTPHRNEVRVLSADECARRDGLVPPPRRPFETRAQMDQELQLMRDFVAELDGGDSSDEEDEAREDIPTDGDRATRHYGPEGTSFAVNEMDDDDFDAKYFAD